MRLKEVELTGVVTLFYSEYCFQKGIIGTNDELRTKICSYYKNLFIKKKKNPHHLLSIEDVSIQNIINVAYRNYLFDKLIYKYYRSESISEIVNLGCGMDTRVHRLREYTGDYYDVDLHNVIKEKRILMPRIANYHLIETKSITNLSFFETDIRLKTSNPLFIAEGVFCYIEYPMLLDFVKRIFKKYPKAILICDVYLFEKHQCFSDWKSKLILKFPEYGEKMIKRNPWLEILDSLKKGNQTPSALRNILVDIALTEEYSIQNYKMQINYDNETYYPNYWCGIYRRRH